MGNDSNPEINLHHSTWQFSKINSVSNNQQYGVRPQNCNSMLFPTLANPYGCICSVNSVNAATPFPGVFPSGTSQKISSLSPPLIPSQNFPEFNAPEKRYLVFDKFRDGRNLIFTSSGIPFPCINSTNPGFDLQGSTETDVSNRHVSEEMHEDTEEIDALLYSDSEDYHNDDEASTGHSPAVALEGTSSEVASSMLPSKRRRVDADEEFDASLIDTASSQVFHFPAAPTDNRIKEGDDDDGESSFIRGVDNNQSEEDQQLKRARIRKTVGILRRIIPGGKGKDAVTVLDEAISYLKSLKLKAKSLNASP